MHGCYGLNDAKNIFASIQRNHIQYLVFDISCKHINTEFYLPFLPVRLHLAHLMQLYNLGCVTS